MPTPREAGAPATTAGPSAAAQVAAVVASTRPEKVAGSHPPATALRPDAPKPAAPVVQAPRQAPPAHARPFVFDRGSRAVAEAVAHPSRDAVAPFPAQMAPPVAFGPRIVAPVDNGTAGASLLAVLAGYVLPGSAPAPASTLILLVVLGLILAAVRPPRLPGIEKLHLLGMLGPSAGHARAVCRPG